MKYLRDKNFWWLLAGVLLAGGCGRPESEKAAAPVVRPVKLFIVGGEEEFSYHYYPAKIRSARRVKLAFQVSGQLVNFPVKSGDPVKKGDLLGSLDPRDFENSVKSAQARYEESKSDFSRYSRLVGKQAVSVALFEERRRIYAVAEAELRIAEKALADTRLLAPFDGVVAATFVDNFQNIQAKQEILSLQGSTEIELVINVPEKDVIKTPGSLSLERLNAMVSPVAIFPALKNRTFPLKLKEFETEADKSTQTFQGVLVMPAPKEFSIMAGMTALVRVRNGRDRGEEGSVFVPVAAVGEDGSGVKYVWTVDQQLAARKRRVEVGAVDGDRIRVGSGLKRGEVIVAAGASQVTEGMKVRQLERIGGRPLRGVKGARP